MVPPTAEAAGGQTRESLGPAHAGPAAAADPPQRAHIHALPNELLLAILADHVPPPDLRSCALVCRRWRQMLNSRAMRHYHNARFASIRHRDRPMGLDLLSYVDLDARNGRGEVPLHLAAALGSVANADVLLGRIALDAARRPGGAVDRAATASSLVNSVDDRGQTPLLVAVANSNIGVAKRLLVHGANANAHDAEGRTPIHAAVELGNVEMVRMLVSCRVHLDVIDRAQMTPLHIAACSMRQSKFKEASTKDHPSAVEIVQILLNSGADPSAVDLHGQTPLHLSSLWSSEVFQIILNRAAWGCCKKSPRLSRSPTIAGAPAPSLRRAFTVQTSSWDARLGHGLLGGIDAAEAAATERAELTTEHPASARDRAGYTPLHRAAQSGNVAAVTAILRHARVDSPALPRGVRPANINALTLEKRRTALHHAAAFGSLECVRALIAAGADVSAEDADGWTPLDHAKNSRAGSECAREIARAGTKRAPPFWAALPIGGRGALFGGDKPRGRRPDVRRIWSY